VELNTTSYAILSLLAVRSWSTYELAQQMDRSLAWFWPSAESVVYATPKELVRLGLATATTEYTGRRPRTVYAISSDGRRALGEWMDREPRGPRLEWEGLLKVAFGDVATREQLLAVLTAMRADADAGAGEARDRANEYLSTGGPFPERLAVIALSGKFLLEWRELLSKWTAWAEQAVAAWDDDTRPIPDNAFRSGWRR
jgi:DNA-binding PadR family transcriptional regulator